MAPHKKQKPATEAPPPSSSQDSEVLSADEVLRRALNVRRPKEGWPWEKKPAAKRRKTK